MQEHREQINTFAGQPSAMSFSETSQPSNDISTQKESTCCTDPRASIVQPRLDKFTLFPQLPSELRLAIWKFALPNGAVNDGKRVFCLDANLVNDNTRLSLVFYLRTVPPDVLYRSVRRRIDELCAEYEDWKKDMRDVSLLGLCKESRDAFLLAFPHTLSVRLQGSLGLIRYNEHTTLHVENWFATSSRRVIGEAGQKNLQLPSINTIRKLALVFRFPYEWDHQEMLRCFGGLRYISMHSPVFSFLPRLKDNRLDGRTIFERDTDVFKRLVEDRFVASHPGANVPEIETFN